MKNCKLAALHFLSLSLTLTKNKFRSVTAFEWFVLLLIVVLVVGVPLLAVIPQ